jgi:hypothetical protein
MTNQEPRFFKKVQDGNRTYELYNGDDPEPARIFLLKKKVDKPFYYIQVKTNQGTWGVDKEGLFLTNLLPWQTNLALAQHEGEVVGFPSMFNLGLAATGKADNFVVEVQCGKGECGFTWMDALRYQKKTVVRCPKCKAYNVIDSSSLHYLGPG